MEKIKNIIVISVFAVLLIGFAAASLIMDDEKVSYSERRKLQQFPEVSIEALFDREFYEEIETYLLDQFPARDEFRKIKAAVTFDVFRQKDNNGIYTVGDGVYKSEYLLDKRQVVNGTQKINALYDKYLEGMDVYYAVIPDKNYYVAQKNGYPAMDYEELLSTVRENVKNIEEINLFDCLGAEDYFRTDPHWRQDKLDGVLTRLEETMGIEVPEVSSYEKSEFYPFYGAYCGQSALNIEPDTIIYLENDVTKNAVLYNYETDSESGVYTPEKYDGMDGYDVFMRGASAFQVLENPQGNTGRELIIFRDSFASSLAPLLLEGYDKITLVDLRYMASDVLEELIEFKNQDVLFLYSTLMMNNSDALR